MQLNSGGVGTSIQSFLKSKTKPDWSPKLSELVTKSRMKLMILEKGQWV